VVRNKHYGSVVLIVTLIGLNHINNKAYFLRKRATIDEFLTIELDPVPAIFGWGIQMDSSQSDAFEANLVPNDGELDRKPAKISIALIDSQLLSRDCIVNSLRTVARDIEVTTYDGYEDCLHAAAACDVVLYHSHVSALYDRNIDDLKISIPRLTTKAPVIILSAFDSPETIVKAVENGARGFISTLTTSTYLLAEIIRLVNAGGTFVPATSLTLRRPEQRGMTRHSAVADLFSPRQMEVLECLKLGKANKIIAHELDMAENTVKVHVRNIMKKMHVTNRTEAAYRAFRLTARGETGADSASRINDRELVSNEAGAYRDR
jgi:DNA-binding NarL/FixJ family response regulator